MSADLEMIITKVNSLSVDELLALQECVTLQLHTKMSSHKPSATMLPVEHPDIYRLTPEEARAGLEKIFTPEELADFAKVDLSNLPQGAKSLSEMVNEDREDRVYN